MYNKTERELLDLYKSVYTEDTEIKGLLVELCENFEYGNTLEERAEFVEGVIKDECIFEFLELVADVFEVDISDILTEETDLTERAALVRGLVNALSRGARSKALKTAGTAAMGKSGNVIRGGAASASTRAARAARGATTAATRAPGGPAAAAKVKKAADISGATKRIPAAGGTGANSVNSIAQRNTTKTRQAVGQMQTFLGGLKKSMKQSAAADKLAAAKVGTSGVGVKTGLPGAAPKAALPAAKGTMTPLKTTSQVGGPLGQRTIKKPGAGLPRQAPKPEWGKGGSGNAGIPKPPRQPGGAISKRPSGSMTTPGVQKVKVKDMGPTGRSSADKGARTLKGDGVVDVSAKTVSSRPTTAQRLKDLGRVVRNNKGKVAAGAAVLGGAALGLATGDGKKTASGDTAPTSPSTPPASKAPTDGGSKAPTGGGSKAPTGGGSKAPTGGGSKAPTGGGAGGGSKAPTGGGSKAPTGGGSKAPEAKSPTSSAKPGRSKADINKEYDRLRKKDPKTGRVMGNKDDLAAAKKFGMAAHKKMYNKESLDTFEIIKGYLIDEGYAGSEEAALVIMTNMSQAWQDQIIESSCGGHSKKKKKKKGY